MSTQVLVKPSEIEKELCRIWDELSKKDKMRACLFNLIVYTKNSDRVAYIRDITQRVIEKFPCRIIFICSDSSKDEGFLETKVSVAASDTSSIVCDHIEITIPTKDDKKIPFLILPHILADLPIYLLWAQDPSEDNAILEIIQKHTTRTIFDSESAKDLSAFAKSMINTAKNHSIADLNWARTESWRSLLAASFHSEHSLEDLNKAQIINISYNAHQTSSYTKCSTQALYIQSWLCSQMGWEYQSSKLEKDLLIITYKTKENTTLTIQLTPKNLEELKAGTILDIEIKTENEKFFEYLRNKEHPHQVIVHASSKDTCAIPYQFIMEKTHVGKSLAKEVYCQSTSKHYISMLNNLIKMDKDLLCK